MSDEKKCSHMEWHAFVWSHCQGKITIHHEGLPYCAEHNPLARVMALKNWEESDQAKEKAHEEIGGVRAELAKMREAMKELIEVAGGMKFDAQCSCYHCNRPGESPDAQCARRPCKGFRSACVVRAFEDCVARIAAPSPKLAEEGEGE